MGQRVHDAVRVKKGKDVNKNQSHGAVATWSGWCNKRQIRLKKKTQVTDPNTRRLDPKYTREIYPYIPISVVLTLMLEVRGMKQGTGGRKYTSRGAQEQAITGICIPQFFSNVLLTTIDNRGQ